MKNSAINLAATNNADGFDLTGGVVPRKLTLASGDVTLTGGTGPFTYTFPAATSTLASLTLAETLTNKTLTAPVLSGGTAGSILFLNSSSQVAQDNASFFWDVTNKRVGIGTNSPATELMVVSTSASDPRGVMTAQYSTDGNGSRLHFRKARGTEAVPVVIVSGDTIGRLRFSGYDGASYLQMGSIDVVSSGTIASTRVPTYMAFSVGTDAAPSVLTERMRIINSGNVGFQVTDPLAGIELAETDTTSVRGLLTGQYSSGTNSSRLLLRKARGTRAAPTTIVTGDNLGTVIAEGYDGANYLQMGAIVFGTEGTIAATRVPTNIKLQTATNAAPSVLTTALTLDSSQNATFAGSIIGSKIYPSADSTTALRLLKADGSTAVLTVDTTNSRVGIGMTPSVALDITGDSVRVNNGGVISTYGGTGAIFPTGRGCTFTGTNGASLSVTGSGASVIFTGSAASDGMKFQLTNASATGSIEFNTRSISRILVDGATGRVGINISSSLAAQLHLVAGSSSTIGQIIDLAGTPSVDAWQVRNSSGTPLSVIDKDGYGFLKTATFALGVGTPISTGTNKTSVALIVPRAGKIVKCFAYAGTAPTGSSILCDINLNGTTIWATQGNRIAIASGAQTGSQTSFDTTTVAEGDLLTIDVDQVGSTVAGQDVTIELLLSLKNQ